MSNQYHRDGASDEQAGTGSITRRIVHHTERVETKAIPHMLGQGRNNMAKHDVVSGNCKKSKHTQCFNLNCTCECHGKVK
jgi:hypothetical protein